MPALQPSRKTICLPYTCTECDRSSERKQVNVIHGGDILWQQSCLYSLLSPKATDGYGGDWICYNYNNGVFVTSYGAQEWVQIPKQFVCCTSLKNLRPSIHQLWRVLTWFWWGLAEAYLGWGCVQCWEIFVWNLSKNCSFETHAIWDMSANNV